MICDLVRVSDVFQYLTACRVKVVMTVKTTKYEGI